jgi:hypothetical protein
MGLRQRKGRQGESKAGSDEAEAGREGLRQAGGELR